MQVSSMKISNLINSEKGQPKLYVPKNEKERILRLYGNWTLDDLDEYYNFNEAIGSYYNTSFQTMMFFMNQLAEEDDELFEIQEQYNKLDKQILKDSFNIVQSAVRSRVGEEFWCQG
tara:strand:- start:23 stop:373 length:351 start_codon:yes stop_codon:yes gene_type:complete